MKSKLTIFLMVCAAFFAACTEDTGLIGVSPSQTISTSAGVYGVTTRTVMLDSITRVKANTSYCYLGNIYDQEIKTRISSAFATQFSILEGMKVFPDSALITSRKDGRPTCDSVFLQLTFDQYYGDKNIPVKVAVYPLKPGALKEGRTYYTTDNLKALADTTVKYTKVICGYDRVHSSDPDDLTETYPTVRIPLPDSVGTNIMDKYWKYLEYSKDKYSDSSDPTVLYYRNCFEDNFQFTNKVCPGYYVEVQNGEGLMIRVFVDNLYMLYQAKSSAASSAFSSYTSFAGTQEVVQTCNVRHENLQELVKNDTCTWLKCPAGLCTVATLPIDEIFSSRYVNTDGDTLTHVNDSINEASLILSRFVNDEQSLDYFDIPQTLLMIRQSEIENFFANETTIDEVSTYIADYSSVYNTYEFDNIGSLISDMYHNTANRAKGWNEVCLIPVTTTSDSYGNITSIAFDLSLASARLVKGTTDNPIKIQLTYSHVNRIQ